MICTWLSQSAKTLAFVVVTATTVATAFPSMPSFLPINITVERQDDLASLIEQLRATDARDRALAACRISKMRRRDVSSAGDVLIGMLGDDTAVESRLCRDWGNWRGEEEQASSPGREAAIALERVGAPAIDALVEELGSSNPVVREHAAFALGLIENRRAVEPLIGVLDDDVAAVRSRVAWSLGMIEDAAAVDALGRSVRVDRVVDVREQAAWALGMIEAASAVPALNEALRDDAAEVREQAAWALGMVESSAAVDALLTALEDEDSDVREQAAWALGMIEDSRAVDGLMEALEDDDAGVRKQVLWALMRCVDADDDDLDYAALAEKLRAALGRGGDVV